MVMSSSDFPRVLFHWKLMTCVVVCTNRFPGGLYSSANHQWIHLCGCHHYCCWTNTFVCRDKSQCQESLLSNYLRPLSLRH
ncbi:hypothetical protein GBAR_LOCUS24912 [Geodia barretti]|uniref:Uncharacterized protein n=1 Tax=Geodia barretti TaxID=519541 RepID=A0AA35TB06_GEOBA|nr:hypothetical protein GBAR_LOCUS24912 [Geodia barretti]